MSTTPVKKPNPRRRPEMARLIREYVDLSPLTLAQACEEANVYSSEACIGLLKSTKARRLGSVLQIPEEKIKAAWRKDYQIRENVAFDAWWFKS